MSGSLAGGRAALVGGAARHDPLLLLAGDSGEEFKIGVVVQDDETTRFGDSRDERIDQ